MLKKYIATKTRECFIDDISLCIAVYILLIIVVWHFDLIHTPLQPESLSTLYIAEGIGYEKENKDAPNLGIKGKDGTLYDSPIFDFSLVGDKTPIGETINKAFDKPVKIWYKEKFHRYIYQLSLEDVIIYDLQEANNNVSVFNRWVPTSTLSLLTTIYLYVYFYFIIFPKYKR